MAGAEDDLRMTFVEHLEELRRRLLKCVLGLGAALVVSFAYSQELMAFIAWPHWWAMDMLGIPPEQQRFISGSPEKPLLAFMKLALVVSLFGASPWIGYQLWAFVAAGLYPRERRYVLLFAPASFALFWGGCAFGFRVLIPYCLYGMARFVDPSVISPTFEFHGYLNLVMTLTIVLGAVFQVPLVMVFLSKLGLVPPRTWNRLRRHAIVVNLVFAAILSPPEVLSTLSLALPLLLLYEVGFAASWLAARPRHGLAG